MNEEAFLVGTVPSLRGCHTQAHSLDKLMERIKEAIQLCLEVEGAPISTIRDIQMVRESIKN